jgi:Transposase
MTTFADAETAQVLGVVDGRDSAGVGTWLAARSCAWREGIEVVAIDPSAAFRRALRIVLRDTVLRDTLTYELSPVDHLALGPLLAQVDAGCPVRMLR